MDKTQLRKYYKDLRNKLSESNRDEKSLKIANRSLELPIWDKLYYHIFLSIEKHNEINTDYLLQILQGKDKNIVVSKSNFITNEMIHYLLQDNTSLKLSEFGIPEPVNGIQIPPDMIDVVFVPLLAFDKKGHRIGYGKGFYDRFLAKCSPETIFVGLSFFEAEESIAHEPMDIPLDYCITPEKTYSFIDVSEEDL